MSSPSHAGPPSRERSNNGASNLWWLTATMLSIGVYCALWPEALLLDEFWDRLPSRVVFGYAIGAMFGGGGALYFAEALTKIGRFEATAAACRWVGSLLLTAGFGYVLWIVFRS